MTRTIHLYFTSENDAVNVRTTLQTQKAEAITIDEMPNAAKATERLFVANEPAYRGADGESENRSGSVEPITEGGPNLDHLQDRGEATVTHMLTFEVKEANYDEVMAAIDKHPYFTDSAAR